MQDGRERALRMLILENSDRVGVGLAGVDLEGKPGLAGGGDVAAEAFGLGLGRRVLVVVVETRLADGHDLRVLREPDDLVCRDVELLVRVVGMRADRAIDVGVLLGDGQDLRKFTDAGRDGHHAGDACRAGTRDHAVEVGGEVGKIQVAVVIDEHLH